MPLTIFAVSLAMSETPRQWPHSSSRPRDRLPWLAVESISTDRPGHRARPYGEAVQILQDSPEPRRWAGTPAATHRIPVSLSSSTADSCTTPTPTPTTYRTGCGYTTRTISSCPTHSIPTTCDSPLRRLFQRRGILRTPSRRLRRALRGRLRRRPEDALDRSALPAGRPSGAHGGARAVLDHVQPRPGLDRPPHRDRRPLAQAPSVQAPGDGGRRLSRPQAAGLSRTPGAITTTERSKSAARPSCIRS